MTPTARQRHVWAVVGYTAIGLLFAWPLPLSLATRLTGPPSGDTGVYVWNLWVFSQELITRGRFPFFTATIFSLDTTADLSLHNYTVFADLLGVPLLPVLGVVPTFNVIYIGITILTAYAMYLLAKEVAGDGVEAWLAGMTLRLFPALIGRGTAHFSLVAAAPLPIFMLLLLRLDRTPRPSLAVALGAVVAWATLCDPYYGVYCVMLAAWHAGSLLFSVERAPRGWALRSGGWRRAVDGHRGGLVVIAVVVLTGGLRFQLLGLTVSMMGLFTPVLVLTLLVVIRLASGLRLHMTPGGSERLLRLVKLVPYAGLSCVAILSPWLYAIAGRIAQGRFVAPRVFWRSSHARGRRAGVPHAEPAPRALRPILSRLARGAERRTGRKRSSVTLVAIVVLVLAVRVSKFRLPRYWLAFTLSAAALAMGPFIRVGGVNTYIPTPWAILRYVPIIESARAPARFTALVMLGMALLLALALKALAAGRPGRRRLVQSLVGLALIFELAPFPRPLYSAENPFHL